MMQEIVFYQLKEGTLMSLKNRLLTVKKLMCEEKEEEETLSNMKETIVESVNEFTSCPVCY